MKPFAFPLRCKLAAALLSLFSCAFLNAQDRTPERRVHANTITSEREPRLILELPRQVQYVGAERWDLYTVADCEVHVFVEADTQKNVQRLYWIQFEAFLPSKPESRYRYNSPLTTTLAGMNFDVSVRVGSNNDKPKPESDLEHVRRLIAAKGYKLPAEALSVRLVHLLDDQKRKELMVIYAEDLAPTGFAVPDLLPGGKAFEQWPTIEKGILQRAEKRLSFRNLD
jgi:hypothetical protein